MQHLTGTGLRNTFLVAGFNASWHVVVLSLLSVSTKHGVNSGDFELTWLDFKKILNTWPEGKQHKTIVDDHRYASILMSFTHACKLAKSNMAEAGISARKIIQLDVWDLCVWFHACFALACNLFTNRAFSLMSIQHIQFLYDHHRYIHVYVYIYIHTSLYVKYPGDTLGCIPCLPEVAGNLS